MLWFETTVKILGTSIFEVIEAEGVQCFKSWEFGSEKKGSNLKTYFSIHGIYLFIWYIFIFSRSVLLILWRGDNNLRIIISQRTKRNIISMEPHWRSRLYWVNTISKEISFHFFFHQYFHSNCRKCNHWCNDFMYV